MERRVVTPHPGYLKKEPSITFFSSGCTLLDCVLGGGYALGRIVNVVGDKSTGKTLLGIEAAVNFLSQYPQGLVAYREAEAAFSEDYATTQLGLPLDKILYEDKKGLINTVEDFFEDLDGKEKEKGFLERVGNGCGLYILDSLDALSSRDEMDRAIDKGSYGAEKARKMSELFRRLTQKIENSKVTLFIISQVRENIGVTFGRKYTRNGGKALDFYASQVMYLAQKKTIEKTFNKVTRPVGVEIKGKNDKNKVAPPYRECEFPIYFGYGVDDFAANLSWLYDTGNLNGNIKELVGPIKNQTELSKTISDVRALTDKGQYQEFNEVVSKEVINSWQRIETHFLPTRKKY